MSDYDFDSEIRGDEYDLIICPHCDGEIDVDTTTGILYCVECDWEEGT